MQFALTPELADRIIFAMENQHEEFVLDTETGDLLSVEELEEQAEEDPDRYVPLPEWTPAHGFRLMERFAEELHNPVYQEKLREALSAGRGVFRRFKDTVKERPEVERRWHRFKEQAMQEVVADWYNELRDTWGLERVAVETAEIEDLVLSDFTIRRIGDGDHVLLEEVRRAAEEQRRESGNGVYTAGRGETAGEGTKAGADAATGSASGRADAPAAQNAAAPRTPPALAFVAEAPGGEIAGAVAAGAAAGGGTTRAATGGAPEGGLVVHTLYVRPTFRGLGLGRLLLERIVEDARRQGWEALAMELAGRGLVLDEAATALGFRTVAKRVSLELSRGTDIT